MNTTSRGIAALATLLVLTGCGAGHAERTAKPATADRAALSEQAPAPPDAGRLGDQPADESAARAADGAAEQGLDSTVAPQPAVISTGTVSLEAEDVGKARLGVRKVVDEHRGTVSQQETTTGEKGRLSTARLVLRVPSDRFDDVIAALEDLATPTGTTTNGEDVTAEVVDVDARIRAQRKSVERVEALLARAESIEQIVAVESQLARRQGDLDALESRQRWLADQTSLSTVTVYIEQPADPDRPDDEPSGFLGGLERGWDSFVDGLGGVLVAVGFLVPWLALVALVAGAVRLVLRRRARGPARTA
ncbi:DUF4349 domain-containing protein [Nocardioides sp. R1-1]|uniref:DUF4349 domain-containing protein n=1 Tax=Nocardioides sp. R1-1 TaxID=3383502 RepID=UPI0038CFE14C